ncbi:P-loop containing nucleoside triphosphate hydrolase protein [Rhypophila decipiens]|uniref:P-loop containing nucleoside triphosphate hydrolase protein n=1 Tax=Rhypophila decipiens TaxID=261697 RepID=A0AAN6XWB0_9PEZI|nr:P-loop containing nucleoside triphosphate hydrolase protein [Rhypophila decipiens]
MATSDILIAVIGVTGAGKTSFISRATGRQDLLIGYDIDSCTQQVIPVTYSINGRTVTLIDTPGFDDSQRSELSILQLVADYMERTYAEGKLLSGIIMMQPLNETRLTGSERTRTTLFKKLLGEDAYQRVVIAPTMWDHLDDNTARLRESQRMQREDVWGDMVSRGAVVVRHSDAVQSATDIVHRFLAFDTTVELLVQRELTQNGGQLALTSAGKHLDQNMAATIQKLTQQVEQLQGSIEAAELRGKIAVLEAEQRMLRERRWWRCVVM